MASGAAEPDLASLQAQLAQENSALARAGLSLRLELRGQRLGLRGPLPCRHGTGRHPVQRISLGLAADAAGLEQAKERLKEVLRQLQQGRFDWSAWARALPEPTPGSPAAERVAGRVTSPVMKGSDDPLGLESFEAAFFADPRRRRNPAGCRTTWTSAYRPYLRRLGAVAAERNWPLGLPLLETVLESYAPTSRSRQQCGTALAALARHMGQPLPEDWAERAAGYGLHAARFRRLPGDPQILALAEQIPNPSWRLAYGLMATYGLRNHEIFFCDLSALAPGGDRVIRVLPTSKTGEHQVWPFQPEWVEHFGLEQLASTEPPLPPVATDLRRTTLQQVGRRVAEQFRRYDLPITPYDLRHAWAVRTIHIGLPDTVAARMMGHSVAIHTRTYHHWITRRDQQQAVDAALARRQSVA
ncbi:site-specific integrase [Cyanobium sp. Aljojuca 7D2]|uniref:site-specific integrase n=1 Tax=Cyanobium sp. Aljojuca 7D2 TaxID=2823698 RepID=UPI0020CBFEC8|nr:site-specific integrase [Cyanobium sp. Aljojuca 7D2]MCP9891849.1 site-specific integrase [Cyanobium sp. Aljojuca 7D2]